MRIRSTSSLRRARAVPVAGLVLVSLAGAWACSPSETNFKTAAEDLIEKEIAEQAALGDLEASCDDPSSTEVGQTFPCSATTPDGGVIEFVATIESDDKVDVQTSNLIVGSAMPQIEEVARTALEEEYDVELADDAIDCGDESVIIEVSSEVLTCTFFDPDSTDEYDATIDISDLNDLSTLVVSIAETPRS